MKGNKKILVIAVLLLLVVVSYTTYAIYKSSATGDASISTAAWVVKVNSQDITKSTSNTFTVDNITWGETTIGKAGTIAPGDKGTVDIVIDASGSQVDVTYAITFEDLKEGETTVTNSKLKAVAHEGSTLTGTIPYSADADGMKKTITLDVKWEAVDEVDQNDIDMDTAAKTLKLPVTVTVTQDPTGL